MSADGNTVVRTIKDEDWSPAPSNTETESDNSIRYGDEISPARSELAVKEEPMDEDQAKEKDDDNELRGEKIRSGDEISPARIERPIKAEPIDVEEAMEIDDDDELDDEEATRMVVTVMELLDPDSVVAMQISNSMMQQLATQHSSTFALRHIDKAVLTKDYAQLRIATDKVGNQPPRTVRMERTHTPTMAALVEWFFQALQGTFVERLQVDDVPVNEAFAACLQKYAPTIRVKDLTCDKVTLQFQDGGSYALQTIFEHFAAVETVDLSGSHGLLSMDVYDKVIDYDKVIAAFTANSRITSLRLPQSDGVRLGQTNVSSKALIDFCFHECSSEQRAVRVLDVYAPMVDHNFVLKVIGRYGTNQGNAQVVLNVHHPIAAQDLEDVSAHARIRDDGMRLRIVDDVDAKILQIRLQQGKLSPRAAMRQNPPASVVAVAPTVKSEPR